MATTATVGGSIVFCETYRRCEPARSSFSNWVLHCLYVWYLSAQICQSFEFCCLSRLVNYLLRDFSSSGSTLLERVNCTYFTETMTSKIYIMYYIHLERPEHCKFVHKLLRRPNVNQLLVAFCLAQYSHPRVLFFRQLAQMSIRSFPMQGFRKWMCIFKTDLFPV